MRRPLVAGNWKMHTTRGDGVALAVAVARSLTDPGGVEVVLCPPFTALDAVGRALASTSLLLGAQHVHWKEEGAWTGEVSVRMLRELSCRYVIVGHSERRTSFHEDDEGVRRRATAVLSAGMAPIVCVGETLEQREQGNTESVLRTQLEGALAARSGSLGPTVIAYEPVWAIGTGRTATPEQAQSAHAFIRTVVASFAGDRAAETMRVLYGGSVKPENAAELFALPDVDGGLIGGASLEAESFVAIARAAAAHDRRE